MVCKDEGGLLQLQEPTRLLCALTSSRRGQRCGSRSHAWRGRNGRVFRRESSGSAQQSSWSRVLCLFPEDLPCPREELELRRDTDVGELKSSEGDHTVGVERDPEGHHPVPISQMGKLKPQRKRELTQSLMSNRWGQDSNPSPLARGAGFFSSPFQKGAYGRNRGLWQGRLWDPSGGGWCS